MVWNHTGAFDRMMWRKYRYPAINIQSEARYPKDAVRNGCFGFAFNHFSLKYFFLYLSHNSPDYFAVRCCEGDEGIWIEVRYPCQSLGIISLK